MIETVTTSIFSLKFKENNENDMAAHMYMQFVSIFNTSNSRALWQLCWPKRLMTHALAAANYHAHYCTVSLFILIIFVAYFLVNSWSEQREREREFSFN